MTVATVLTSSSKVGMLMKFAMSQMNAVEASIF